VKKIIFVALAILISVTALAARDGAGNYTLPSSVNPVIPGQPIKASWANTTLSDLATEMTWSLDRRGYGGMTAPLACTAGSASAPSLTFNGALSSGLYLKSASPATVGLSTAASDRQIWTAAGSTLSVPLILPVGSAAAPSVTFLGNLTTGLYSPGASQVSVAVGGVPVTHFRDTDVTFTTSVINTVDVTFNTVTKHVSSSGKKITVSAPVVAADFPLVLPAALPSNPVAWAAGQPYTVGTFVTNGANIYVCDTAGTSAASGGPVGTGSDITDNTARWDYVQAAPVTDPVKLAATTGQLSTGKITNIDQNFGTPVQDRDVAIKSYVTSAISSAFSPTARTWTTLTVSGSNCAAAAGTDGTPKYAIVNGVVYLRGGITHTSPTASSACSLSALPVGARPATDRLFGLSYTGGLSSPAAYTGTVTAATGVLAISSTESNTVTWRLDNVIFPTEQ
jgi:hypothetical protein